MKVLRCTTLRHAHFLRKSVEVDNDLLLGVLDASCEEGFVRDKPLTGTTFRRHYVNIDCSPLGEDAVRRRTLGLVPQFV